MQTLRKLDTGIICGNNFSGGFLVWQGLISKLVLFHTGGIVSLLLIFKHVLFMRNSFKLLHSGLKGGI